ncbi:MAG: hypothetical protein EYC70_01210 [Planctomycetota bacterium]|nr:MAG: hypothetical protein EYC70_01210 [Planctomycetota bacterium]
MAVLILLFGVCQDPGGIWMQKWRIDGSNQADGLDGSVAGIADVDGDGHSDAITGVEGLDLLFSSEGGARLYSGATGGLVHEWNGTVVQGHFGNDVASIPDLDGDGFEDVLIAAINETTFVDREGAVHVMSGQTGAQLHWIPGTEVAAEFGRFVACAGDVDGDGTADILIGAPGSDFFIPGFGATFVYSGRTMQRILAVGGLGTTVGRDGVGLDDVNGDGLSDLLVSESTNQGTVRVYSGADGSEIYSINRGIFDAAFGYSVGNVGDIDRDGASDFIVGEPGIASYTRKGRALVYSGRSGAELFRLWGDQEEDKFGFSVAGAGDADGDGYPDMLVGAEDTGPAGQGAVFVHSGFDGRLLGRIVATLTSERLGWSVASTPDVDGDGLPDIVAGAPFASYGAPTSGSVYVVILQSYLEAEPRSVSAAAGGTVAFTLDFPDSEGGKLWRLLASNDRPGRTTAVGVSVPLTISPVLDQMLHDPPPVFSATTGVLDANGDATATMTLAPGQAAGLVGTTLRFAAISLDAPKDPRLSSTGVRITVLP